MYILNIINKNENLAKGRQIKQIALQVPLKVPMSAWLHPLLSN